MNGILGSLYHAALPILLAGVGALVTPLIARVNAFLPHATDWIKNDLLRSYADMAVKSIEQKFAKTISNPDKKAKALAALRTRFPKVPMEILDAAIEAAVKSLKPVSS